MSDDNINDYLRASLDRLETKMDTTASKLDALKDVVSHEIGEIKARIATAEAWRLELDRQREFWTVKAWPDHLEHEASVATRVVNIEKVQASLAANSDKLDQLEDRIDEIEKWRSKMIGIGLVVVALLTIAEGLIFALADKIF
jgi:predicted RNase H-like nuclease (RuvC/YqgF family)